MKNELFGINDSKKDIEQRIDDYVHQLSVDSGVKDPFLAWNKRKMYCNYVSEYILIEIPCKLSEREMFASLKDAMFIYIKHQKTGILPLKKDYKSNPKPENKENYKKFIYRCPGCGTVFIRNNRIVKFRNGHRRCLHCDTDFVNFEFVEGLM